MTAKDFLLEIGCAELPAKGLWPFAQKLGETLTALFHTESLYFDTYQCFATPRRLAVLVKDLSSAQPDKIIKKRGPSLKAPLTAKEGFAASCGISAELLQEEEGYWIYSHEQKGKTTAILLPALIRQALNTLSGVKWMHWGNHASPFLRPVEWVTLLYGSEKIPTELFSKKTVDYTQGHRFQAPQKIRLTAPQHYEDSLLEEGFVMADFVKRRHSIRTNIEQLAAQHNAKALIDDALLDEVTGLVEWPVALLCHFPETFLDVPKEALISAMQTHQKCFPLVNNRGELHPFFIVISNIKSYQPEIVQKGNERVMKARLSDAAYFYAQDKKSSLLSYTDALYKVIFQKKLGSMGDKIIRVQKLSVFLAKMLHADTNKCLRAAALCKADLMTMMVGEFPELQGIMGEYYAKASYEPEDIALAIREHYLPRFAGDNVPRSAIGCVIALADRIDTITGIFGIGEIPSGDKDPFALRRQALGIIRIAIEKNLTTFSLSQIIDKAIAVYSEHAFLPETKENIQQFLYDRLPAYYQEQGVALDTIQAVLDVQRDNFYDLHQRILAVEAFRQLPEAAVLSDANKRVKNILKKNQEIVENLPDDINIELFKLSAEKILYEKIMLFSLEEKSKKSQNFTLFLQKLAALHAPVNIFFDEVMVDVPDEKIKQNRLQLLKKLRTLFLEIADISLLQSKKS